MTRLPAGGDNAARTGLRKLPAQNQFGLDELRDKLWILFRQFSLIEIRKSAFINA
jgi:hypothetical protein